MVPKKLGLVAVGLLVLAAGVWAVDAYLLPEPSTQANEALVDPTTDRATGDGKASSTSSGEEMEAAGHPSGNTTEAGSGSDEPATDTGNRSEAQGPTPLASARFEDGDRYHSTSGSVTLYQGENGQFLRFEEYEATDGPDVYVYLVQDPTDGSSEAVESGVKVPVPGGAEDGQATVRGTFNVPLPEGLDASTYGGLVIWCEDFNVVFGTADWR